MRTVLAALNISRDNLFCGRLLKVVAPFNYSAVVVSSPSAASARMHACISAVLLLADWKG